MNTPKIDCQEQIQQNHGLIDDFASHSSQYFGNLTSWNEGIHVQPSIMEAGSQQENLKLDKSSSTIMSRFESPASAFYATERYLRFPQYDCQIGSSLYPPYSKTYDSQIPSHHCPGENYSADLGERDNHFFELRNSLQSAVKSHFSGNYHKSLDKSGKVLCCSSSGNKLQPHERNKLLVNDAASIGSYLSMVFQGNQDHRVGCNPYTSQLAQLGFSSQQENRSPKFSYGVVASSPGNHVSTGSVLSSKTRIRWTQDLHDKFVECVNCLGGAEKATPKAILKLMDSDVLTIFHVKSHLQKYRLAKHMRNTSEGKAEKRPSIDYLSQLDVKTGLQITEALQLQFDFQRCLHDQLENQRNLQLRIEEQGRQLRMMFDQQQITNNSLFKNQDSDITSSN